MTEDDFSTFPPTWADYDDGSDPYDPRNYEATLEREAHLLRARVLAAFCAPRENARARVMESLKPCARNDRPLCGARCRSKAGAPCIARVCVRPDGTLGKRCRMHGGLSTGPRTQAGRQRCAEAARARAARERQS